MKNDFKLSRNLEVKMHIKKMMSSGKYPDAPEKLIAAFVSAFDPKKISYEKAGCFLFNAFLENDVDAALLSLCNCSFDELMVKAGLLPENWDHLYNPEAAED